MSPKKVGRVSSDSTSSITCTGQVTDSKCKTRLYESLCKRSECAIRNSITITISLSWRNTLFCTVYTLQVTITRCYSLDSLHSLMLAI